VFVLLHGPLVGPYTWSLVAEELRARDCDVVLPTFPEAEGSAVPAWHQYAASVAHALTAAPRDRPLHWIGQSGPGPLLPALRHAVPHPVASYVFVDAGIPRHGDSYLDLLTTELPDQVDALRQMLQAGERFPNWNEAMLRPLSPTRNAGGACWPKSIPSRSPFLPRPFRCFRRGRMRRVTTCS
jgi:hypothetical protein